MSVTTKIYYGYVDSNTLDIISDLSDSISGVTYSEWSIIQTKRPPWYNQKASLKNITVGRNNNKIAPYYCNSWFSACTNLELLDLSGLDTSNVTDMKTMFSDCRALTTLNVSGFDTSNVTDMRSMFSGCQALTTLDVSNFDTSKVSTMSGMFNSCKALTTLDLSNFNTSATSSMSSMFSGCQALTTLDVSNFDTSNVSTMSSMFANCWALTTLDVSGFDTSNVTEMTNMFYYCRTLTTVDVSGFNTSNVTDMKSMFYYCTALATLDVSGFDTSFVRDMSYMFSNCRALTTLDVSGFHTSYATSMSGMFNTCQTLTTLDVSGFDTSNVTDMSYMFYNCQALTALDVSGFDTSNVTNMSYMFYNCQTSALNVSGFDTSNVTDMRSMFFYCRTLTTLDVSNFDTSNVTDMSYMFASCQALTTLDVSNFNISNVTDMRSMFLTCQALTMLYFPQFSTHENVVVTDIFKNTTQNIYLINSGTQTQTIIVFWRNIASQYTNVHYEFDDNSLPSVSNYSVLRVGSDGSTQYIESGEYAYLKVTVDIYSNYLPPGYINALKSINLLIDGVAALLGDITWTTQDTDFPKVYEGWYDIGETGDRHTFEVSSSDTITQSGVEKASRTSSVLSFDLPKSVALIDYYHDQTTGEEGMAIGAFASNSNLLDVAMPTLFRDTVSLQDNNSVIRQLFDFIYPVGSYYETSVTSFDPNVTWGGTWVLENAGLFHVSSGGGTINGATADNGKGVKDGGDASVTLTANQSGNQSQNPTVGNSLGTHSHNAADGYFLTITAGANVAINGTKRAYTAANSGGIHYVYCGTASGIGEFQSTAQSASLSHSHTVTVDAKDAIDAHENRPPFVVVNRWHRTA